ncbi:MAG TPA: SMC-Scp complex subunit ScpB [Bacteroidota bacterium]|nr:SMC-Scp complex subunit ScpB [Bacteroidota bacterium]
MSETPESPELNPLDQAAPPDPVHESGEGTAAVPSSDVVAVPPDDAVSETVTEPEEIDEPFTDEEAAELRAIVEALVFASDEPISAKFIRQIIEDVNRDRVEGNRVRSTTEGIKRAVAAINRTYADRAFHIISIAGGFAFATKPKYSVFVGKLAKEKARRKLSATAIESLAIIAYKQPITKSEIEFIRGVNADYIIKTLLEKNLITITGRASTPGRPLLYGTTDEFLKHFGLNEITDLPKPREIEELIGETELEVEKRLLAEQQELEFKDELSQKLEGGQKSKPSGPRPPLRQQTGRPAEKGAEPAVSTPPAPEAGSPQPIEDVPATDQVAPLQDPAITADETASAITIEPENEEASIEHAEGPPIEVESTEDIGHASVIASEPIEETGHATVIADEPIEEIEQGLIVEDELNEESDEEETTDELFILDGVDAAEPVSVAAVPRIHEHDIESASEMSDAIVEESVVGESQHEEIPAEDSHLEQTLPEEVKTEELHADDMPADEVKTEGLQVEDMSADEVTTEELQIEQIPLDESAVEELQVERTISDEAVIDRVPIEETQVEELLEEQSVAETRDEPVAATEESHDEHVEEPVVETNESQKESIEMPTADAAAHDEAAQSAADDAHAGEPEHGDAHAPEKGWSKWKTKIKTFFKKLFE